MKTGTEGKLKFRQMMRDLKLRLFSARGLLDTLWDFVKNNCPAGDIGRFSDEDIAMAVDWPEEESGVSASALIEVLIKRRWIDRIDSAVRLIIHDWPEHCEDVVHKALARRSELFADGSMPSLSRFNLKERKTIEQAYKKRFGDTVAATKKRDESQTDLHENAQERVSAHVETPVGVRNTPQPGHALPGHTLPSPAMPYHTMPSQTPAAPVRESATKNGPEAEAGKPGAGIFKCVTTEMLRDPAAVVAWFERASRQRKPVVSRTDSNRLRVMAAAVRALEVGDKPAALFASIVAKADWEKISNEQDEKARVLLRDYQRQERGPPMIGQVIASAVREAENEK